MKKQDAIENHKVLSDTLQKWLVFKRHFLKAFTQEPISPEDEQEFLEVKSQVNKNSRLLSQRLKEVGYEGDKISNVLRQCISVAQLRAMPIPDRRGLYKEWHAIFVKLNQVDGALEFMARGWVPRALDRQTGTSISDIKRMGGGAAKRKKKTLKVVIVLVVLVLAGAVVGGLFASGILG
jgi:hypothetical protein